MISWIIDTLLGVDLYYTAANSIWNFFMDMCEGSITQNPTKFAGGSAWTYIETQIYPLILGCAAVIMNALFLISIIRTVQNLHENITTELVIEILVKVIAANALLQVGLDIMKAFFGIATDLVGLKTLQLPQNVLDTSSSGGALFWMIFGLFYILVSLVCGMLIFLAIYGRFLKVYVLAALCPIAVVSIIGGRGIDSTGSAWLRSFLNQVFSVVVIAITMVIAGKICSFVPETSSFLDSVGEGFTSCMRSMMYMILMTGSVMGTSQFLQKSLNW